MVLLAPSIAAITCYCSLKTIRVAQDITGAVGMRQLNLRYNCELMLSRRDILTRMIYAPRSDSLVYVALLEITMFSTKD